MALLHISSHRITRTNPSSASTVQLCESEWPKTGLIEELFRELKLAMIKRLSKEYGQFTDDYSNHPLSSWLKSFKEGKTSFERFTQDVMKQFAIELDKSDIPIDGFLLFANEALEHEELLHIFFVQQNTALQMGNGLTLQETLYLDTNIQLAVKINITDWQANDPHQNANALTLLRWRGEKELSEAFESLIGFTNKINLSADTEQFLQAVSGYTKPLSDEIAFQTKRKIVDFCLEQDKQGKAVNINELSSQLRSDSEDSSLPDFSQFINEVQSFSKPELIPDKSQLRQFVRISGRDHRLSMSFSSSCLGDNIDYDLESDRLTIHNIPPALKARLKKHLGETT